MDVSRASRGSVLFLKPSEPISSLIRPASLFAESSFRLANRAATLEWSAMEGVVEVILLDMLRLCGRERSEDEGGGGGGGGVFGLSRCEW